MEFDGEMSGRDVCVQHTESGVYVDGETRGQDASEVDGKMSGRIACVQQVETDVCASFEYRKGEDWE